MNDLDNFDQEPMDDVVSMQFFQSPMFLKVTPVIHMVHTNLHQNIQSYVQVLKAHMFHYNYKAKSSTTTSKISRESLSELVLSISFSAEKKALLALKKSKKPSSLSMRFFKPSLVKFLRHVFKRGNSTPLNHGGEAWWRRPSTLPLFMLIFAVLIISFGGAIRIHDAGESCPDWPKCFGTYGFDISEDEQAAYWEENSIKSIQEAWNIAIQCLKYS